ncbi:MULTISPECIES: glycosyltransferase [unclassified Clostridium]|uniref:glycosyltransferase n=1 Tax=unclassified Clostridium TaxID=2614128 RepID=UPI000297E11A|nr:MULTISPECIES: glycosyltransferase [unclassified Clostridium]EKQ56945.1 MAG: glycosyltransferase [Clostridium sp. Maddingley MBC34-26]
MKVIHLIMSFDTGGAEKLLIDILNNCHIDQQGLCIVNNLYNTKLLNEVNAKNIEIKLINRPESSKNIIYIIELLRYMRKENPEIIHCHNKASFKLAIYIKKFIKKLDIIYTIHDTNIVNVDKKLVIDINKFCKKVICISKPVEDECIENLIDKSKIITVNNGIDIEKFNLPKNNHLTINIVCIARIHIEKKGQDLLIRAVKDIAEKYNIIVYFAGDASVQQKEDLNYLKGLCEQLNLRERVKFLGNVENIPELLRSMDILILPSRYEGFGLVIIEGMASKTRVIASNIDGPKNIITKDSGYLFKSGDYRDLQEKIEECIISGESKVNYAYEYAIKEYSIDRLCSEYEKIYIN